MKSLDNLKQDHLAVERVLNLIDEACNRVQAGHPLPAGFERWAVESLSRFVDHCHHVKEESALFPLLWVRGTPKEAGPCGMILTEQKRGRILLRRMMDDAVRRDHLGFAMVAKEYARWLRRHMFKENHVIFQMAETCLTAEDDSQLVKTFRHIEQEFGGDQLHEQFDADIKRWEDRFREPVTQGEGGQRNAIDKEKTMTSLEEQKSIDPMWVRIAWHLSGHAIVAARLGFRINEGRIFMTGKHHGQVRCKLPGRTMDHMSQAERKVAALKCIAVLAAGRIAEDKADTLKQLPAGSEIEYDEHDPEGDKEQIDQFAACAAADDEVLLESLKRNGTALAEDIVQKDLGNVEELAGSFLQSTGTVAQQTIYSVAGVKAPMWTGHGRSAPART